MSLLKDKLKKIRNNIRGLISLGIISVEHKNVGSDILSVLTIPSLKEFNLKNNFAYVFSRNVESGRKESIEDLVINRFLKEKKSIGVTIEEYITSGFTPEIHNFFSDMFYLLNLKTEIDKTEKRIKINNKKEVKEIFFEHCKENLQGDDIEFLIKCLREMWFSILDFDNIRETPSLARLLNLLHEEKGNNFISITLGTEAGKKLSHLLTNFEYNRFI